MYASRTWPTSVRSWCNRVIDLSVKTAQLLGFYGHGIAKVKVDYVGRAPIAGSDDRKLMATLRDGSGTAIAAALPAEAPQPARAPIRVASAESFAPAYFDARPMTDVAARAPATAPLPQAEPAVSPVSAYAPTRYDGHTGFMSGRGLY
jgi:rare lipoprotein A